ncbi:MAG: RNA polymerase factor sigma-54 [Planctomycetes bacterium]|nr:RNA polymerase factor sigma-54 [Planctomycetota bacterium]
MSGPGMSLDMRLGQRLEQRQVLSLQTIQSLNILQLAPTDLQNLIDNELLENPTLDLAAPEGEEDRAEPTPAEAAAEAAEEAPEPTTELGETYSDVIEYLERNTEVESANRATRVSDEEADAKQEAFNAVAAPGRTLAEHLLEQLRLKGVDELDWPLVEALVYSLDSRGYLAYPLEDILKGLGGRYSLEEAQWALSLVQGLEPRGVGARTLAECLLLQIGKDDPDYPHLQRLLTELWDDVLKNRLPKVAKDMGITVDEVKLLVDMLGALNPHPGSLYSETPAQVVTPDVIIEEDENNVLQVRLTRENVPRLNINPTYLKLLQEKQGDKATLQFVKSKLNHARALIEALAQRQTTLERVARSIVRRQEEFVRAGLQGLRPMKMQDIADELGIHHSTVWRAVYGKFMQTPQGIFAMNELFTGGLPAGDEGAVSREAVKLKVKEIVDGEDKKRPLSDMVIAQKLKDLGIEASRRVVTKYREELGLADSRVRKAH